MFKIGDRIKSNRWEFQPTAIVTKITEKGFKYKLTKDYNLGSRIGYISKDNECESFTFDGWRLEEDKYEI